MAKNYPAPIKKPCCLRSVVLKHVQGGSPNFIACFVEHYEALIHLNNTGFTSIWFLQSSCLCQLLAAISALSTSLVTKGTEEVFQVDPVGVRVSLRFWHLAEVTEQFHPLP